MNYSFGPNKPKYIGSTYDLCKLREKIAWWDKKN